MSFFHGDRRIPTHLALAWAGLLCLLSATAGAQGLLDRPRAERLALDLDPEIVRLQQQREALGERAVAAGQLPDPGVKLGVMSLPVDSFAFDQEPMTQFVVGAQQMFPAGDTRALREEQMRVQAGAQAAMADDRKRQVVAEVRKLWLELAYNQQAEGVVQSQLALYRDLSGTIERRYTAGRGGQQDIVRIGLEQDLLREQLIGLKREAAGMRASLSEWIGEAAFGELDLSPAPLPPLPEPAALEQRIGAHPMVQADQVRMQASEVGEDLARQRYKPDWGLEVSYGLRDGNNPDGSARPDFFSAMLMFSVPLFTADRQDRAVAAASAETRAALNQVKNRQRTLRARAEMLWENYRQQQEMLELYSNDVLPAAQDNVQATLTAYEGQRASFDEYIRAENMALSKSLRAARLQANVLRGQVDLLYLLGETP